MKKHPIVQEYKNEDIHGLEIMKEQANFLTSKMMDIEDIVNITYYICPQDIEKYNRGVDPAYVGNNINSVIEKFYETKYKFGFDKIKKDNIELTEDDKQRLDESSHNTTWKFRLNSKGLLRDYLFNEFYINNRENSVFTDLETYINNNGLSNYRINDIVYDYIDSNVIDKYRFKQFKLYVKYYELSQDKVNAISYLKKLDNEVKLFIKKPVFDIKAINDKNTFEVVSIKPYVDGFFDIYYKQLKSSKKYTFLYYYDVVYEKI